MVWVIGIIVVILVVGASLVPSQRARDISALSPLNRKMLPHDVEKEARVLPKEVSDRDVAYVLEYYKRFGERRFTYGAIKGKRLSRNLMDAFGVKSGPLDDKNVLGNRLPELGLLASAREEHYQLTEAGIKLAKLQTQRDEAL